MRRGDTQPGHALHHAEGGWALGGHAAPPPACPPPCGNEARLWGDTQDPRRVLSNEEGGPAPAAWHCQEGPHGSTPAWLPPFPRLLAQLNETEAAFDEFWAKHQQKLEQCLQLRHFEQDFREVSGLGGCRGALAWVMCPVGTTRSLEEPGVWLEPQCRWYILPDGIPSRLPSCFTVVLAVLVPSPPV